MPIIFKSPSDIKPSEITSESDYQNRRQFIKQSAVLLGAAWAGRIAMPVSASGNDFPGAIKTSYGLNEKQNSFEDITSYNNFYEFGTSKTDPARNAMHFTPRPWTVTVEGEIANPGVFDLDDFIKPYQLEERIYRLRCVEGWSMVIPWIGFSLAEMIRHFKPTSRAKYVEFTTLYDPERMPGQKRRVLNWPYTEGLRIDEAMNSLSLMSVGLYGKTMPNQNGAPIRLVVPWKYGFKSIKSVVKIRFTETQPVSTWNKTAPDEYGFYSNVNPDVDHPRWSQKTERRIGSDFWQPKIETQMFNGYAEQVASLYTGMDLKRYF
ncbi:MAG: protein-methionine-sulfoxide reductase catalytic subunit MsrP [Gammaproteobacteria bacterium]|nr:protein-methionine-sulfoxide reductase catalytic subunit MsrP [Gammaproteobacteria bacterium]MDH5734496.1 protein-methionine-sulfoxide reductase catalytic subunit MsrP [Gammaproteobacteria bacterium]